MNLSPSLITLTGALTCVLGAVTLERLDLSAVENALVSGVGTVMLGSFLVLLGYTLSRRERRAERKNLPPPES